MRTTTLDSNARGLSPILCGLVAVAVAAVLALWAETAHAIPKVERYVNVSVTPATLDLGSVPQPGTYDSPSELKAHVTANCVHGGVVASVTALERAGGGGSIGPERVFVKLPATDNYVAMTNPVAVTGPMNPGVFDVILKFRVETTPEMPAGTYTGTFQLEIGGWEGYPPVPGPTVQYTLELELYASYQVVGGSCYIHLGNVFTATEQDMTVHPTGTLTTNGGMYIGMDLSAMGGVSEGAFEKDGNGNLTGRIARAMAGTLDVLGRNISGEAIDVRIRLSWNGGGAYVPPDYFGDSPDGEIGDTVWWLVNGGAMGTYALDWEILLLPEAGHPDGNYYFQAEVVVAPLL